MDRYVVELRAAEIDGNRLVGHAAVFNRMAQRPGHWEQVAAGAFDEVLAGEPDVRALINHDPNQLLARTANGTLKLGVDRDGLVFEAELPDTSYARDLRDLVHRGLVTGASFGFVPGSDKWGRAPDGTQLRTHTSVAMLRDVGPVTFPAYTDTAVQLRSVTFPAHPLRHYRSRLILTRAAQKGIRP